MRYKRVLVAGLTPIGFVLIGLVLIGLALIASSCRMGAAATEASVPAVNVSPAAESEPEPAPTAPPTTEAERYQSIADVDFRNGFTYEHRLSTQSETQSITVVDGHFVNGTIRETENYFSFGVDSVTLGDLDDDGVDDAIVSVTWNGGGTGFFDSVIAYRLVDGVPQSAGTVRFGDRAHGGIHDVEIIEGVATVRVYATDNGACCPNQIVTHRLAFDQWLSRGDHGMTRRYVQLGGNGPNPATELDFLAGTSDADLGLPVWSTGGSITFDASAGQVFELTVLSGPTPTAISVTDLTTGTALEVLNEVPLPSSGSYEIAVSFDESVERSAPTTIRVGIDVPESPDRDWTPRASHQVIDHEFDVRSELSFPAFDGDNPGIGAANEAIRGYVEALDDWWIDGVSASPGPIGDSTFELSFEVAMVSDTLASVRLPWLAYACCQPYPNYGTEGLTVDLATGRLLAPGEILDLSRLDEITTLWIAELERSGKVGDDLQGLLTNPTFDAIALADGGIEFHTDRGSLAGGFPGTSTLVSFDLLGDLVTLAR